MDGIGSNLLKTLLIWTQPNPKLKIKFQLNLLTYESQSEMLDWVGLFGVIGWIHTTTN